MSSEFVEMNQMVKFELCELLLPEEGYDDDASVGND